MTRRAIHRFKRVLEDMKAELTHSLENSVDRLVSQSADAADQMRDLREQEVASRNISLVMGRLRELEDALRAIRKGSFGRCASCDDEIPIRRLEAVPWTSYCVACQEDAEAQQSERAESEHGLTLGATPY